MWENIFLYSESSEFSKNVITEPPFITPYFISFWFARASNELIVSAVRLTKEENHLHEL